MIRVLHYVGNMKRGGMETFIMNLYHQIDRSQIQFDFAIHGENAGDFKEEILSLGGNFYYFPHMRKNPLKYRAEWRNFWKNNKDRYSVFHMHTNSLANTIALEEATKANIPIRIIHSHSSMANRGNLQWLNDILQRCHQRKIPQLATHLFSCSDKAAEWLFGGTSIGNMSVIQINNGVDIEKFKYDENKRKKIRLEFALSKFKVIGHIGAFLPVKNHQFIIDVVEQAYRQDNSVRCMLIGTGTLLEEMKKTVCQKGLEDIIMFLGVRSDVADLLSAMDIFIMPSLFEGLPVSLIEVQANGLPSLISDSITRNVKLKDNVHYMALSNSKEDWARKALEIINNGERDDDNTCITQSGFDIKDTARLNTDIVTRGQFNAQRN